MSKNLKNFIYLNFVIVLAVIFYQFTTTGLPSRKIAQVTDQITRNRVIEPERYIRAVHSRSKFEKVVRLKNARIVIADYELIKRDFPQIKDLSNGEIDNWILNQVAFVSLPQSEQTVVNTKIPIKNEFTMAARPPDYGRALVFAMGDPQDNESKIGLIDVKGAGALNPGQADHSNGVATLGECIREYLYENLVRDVLDDADLPNKTVGSYAVIDAGFGVVHKDGSTSAAGLYLRQAHHRVTNPGAWLSVESRQFLQLIFHEYGIDPNRNIQGTTNGDIFDFGHYVVKDDLNEINPTKQIPFKLWGYDKSIKSDPSDRWFYSKRDYPWQWSHELAESFATGRANRQDVLNHFQNLINPVREKLTTHRIKEYALDDYISSSDITNFLKRMNFEKNVFVIDNIKSNLLKKNKIADPWWKNLDTLTELTKSLDLLAYDLEVEELHQKIIEMAIDLKAVNNTPMPKEIAKLIKNKNFKGTTGTCTGIASRIIFH